MSDEESPADKGSEASPDAQPDDRSTPTATEDSPAETSETDTEPDATGENTDDASPLATVGTRLDELRADPLRRRLATLGALALSLAVVWVHWLGFVLGGALVALVQPSIRRGLAAGLGFGVVCWLAFAVWLSLADNFLLFLGMGQVFAVTSLIPLAGGLLGSLARGIR